MIVTTCATMEQAETLARLLLTERLAACVNTFPQVKSFYWWKDEIQAEEEIFLQIKTTKELEWQVMKRIKEVHPYDVPAIYTLDSMTNIDQTYLAWIRQETRNNQQ